MAKPGPVTWWDDIAGPVRLVPHATPLSSSRTREGCCTTRGGGLAGEIGSRPVSAQYSAERQSLIERRLQSLLMRSEVVGRKIGRDDERPPNRHRTRENGRGMANESQLFVRQGR